MKRIHKNAKDVRYILDNLREADRIECQSQKGENYKEIIFNDIMNTEFDCLVGEDSNRPIVMGGVWSVDEKTPDIGIAWLLSTDEIRSHQAELLRKLKQEFVNYDKKFFIIFNYIHKQNLSARRWLDWLGFKFEKLPGIPEKENFTFFYRINPNMKGMKDVYN